MTLWGRFVLQIEEAGADTKHHDVFPLPMSMIILVMIHPGKYTTCDKEVANLFSSLNIVRARAHTHTLKKIKPMKILY